MLEAEPNAELQAQCFASFTMHASLIMFRHYVMSHPDGAGELERFFADWRTGIVQSMRWALKDSEKAMAEDPIKAALATMHGFDLVHEEAVMLATIDKAEAQLRTCFDDILNPSTDE